MSIVETILAKRTKKVTINFPTAGAMWQFFETTDLKEFRLDSSKCSVTGRFLPLEIEKAQREMNAIVREVSMC